MSDRRKTQKSGRSRRLRQLLALYDGYLGDWSVAAGTVRGTNCTVSGEKSSHKHARAEREFDSS